MEPRCGVHPFVEVFFLNVGMAVKMDDTDFLGRAFGDTAHTRKTNRVVAADHDWQTARAEHMADRAADLIE